MNGMVFEARNELFDHQVLAFPFLFPALLVVHGIIR